jgi:hypothetical protein
MKLGGCVVPALHKVPLPAPVRLESILPLGLVGVFQSPAFGPFDLRSRIKSVGACFLLSVTGKARPSRAVALANVVALIRVPLRAMGQQLRGEPPLLNGVLGVVSGRSQKEMGGVHAPTIIASVTDEQPVRDWPVVQLVGKAVGGHAFIVDAQFPVRTAVNRSVSPRPASRAERRVQWPIRVGLFPKPPKQTGAYSHTANIARSRGFFQ